MFGLNCRLLTGEREGLRIQSSVPGLVPVLVPVRQKGKAGREEEQEAAQ